MTTTSYSAHTLANQIGTAYKQAHPHNTSSIIESLHLIRKQRSERSYQKNYVSNYCDSLRFAVVAVLCVVVFIFVYRFFDSEFEAPDTTNTTVVLSLIVSALAGLVFAGLSEILQTLLPMQTVLGFLYRRGVVTKVTEAQHIVECHDREYALIAGAMEDAVGADIQKTYGVRWVITPYGYKVTNVHGVTIWRASDIYRVINKVQDNITVIYNGHYRSIEYATIEGEHISLALERVAQPSKTRKFLGVEVVQS